MPVSDRRNNGDPFEQSWGESIWAILGRESVARSDKHSVAFVTLPQGKSSRLHRHHVSEESYYVLSGRARVRVQDEEFTM